MGSSYYTADVHLQPSINCGHTQLCTHCRTVWKGRRLLKLFNHVRSTAAIKNRQRSMYGIHYTAIERGSVVHVNVLLLGTARAGKAERESRASNGIRRGGNINSRRAYGRWPTARSLDTRGWSSNSITRPSRGSSPTSLHTLLTHLTRELVAACPYPYNIIHGQSICLIMQRLARRHWRTRALSAESYSTRPIRPPDQRKLVPALASQPGINH